MANKRMFSNKITGSDAFTEMPSSAQCLYFQLCMNADDDGFIGNARSVMLICGANKEDLKILIEKRFLLSFENSVFVIKHWRIHNSLSRNRYHETVYLDEKKKMYLKSDGSYSLTEGYMIDDSALIENQKSGKSSAASKEDEIGAPNCNIGAPDCKSEAPKAYCGAPKENSRTGHDSNPVSTYYNVSNSGNKKTVLKSGAPLAHSGLGIGIDKGIGLDKDLELDKSKNQRLTLIYSKDSDLEKQSSFQNTSYSSNYFCPEQEKNSSSGPQKLLPRQKTPETDNIIAIPLMDGSCYGVTQEDEAAYAKSYPELNIREVFLGLEKWVESNPVNINTPAEAKDFIDRWFSAGMYAFVNAKRSSVSGAITPKSDVGALGEKLLEGAPDAAFAKLQRPEPNPSCNPAGNDGSLLYPKNLCEDMPFDSVGTEEAELVEDEQYSALADNLFEHQEMSDPYGTWQDIVSSRDTQGSAGEKNLVLEKDDNTESAAIETPARKTPSKGTHIYSIPLSDGSSYQVSQDDMAYFESLCPKRRDVTRELGKIEKYFEKFSAHLKSAEEIVDFISGWLVNGPAADPEPVCRLQLNDGSWYPIHEEDLIFYRALYPAVELEDEFRKMIGWIDANPKKRKTRQGIKRFIASWLSKEQDKGRGGSGSRPNGYVSKTAQMLESSYAMYAEWAQEMEEARRNDVS